MIHEKTIAVLPFKNRSNNEEEDYFGDVNIIDIQEYRNLPTIIVVHGIKGADLYFLRISCH